MSGDMPYGLNIPAARPGRFDADVVAAVGKHVRITRTGPQVEVWAGGKLAVEKDMYVVRAGDTHAYACVHFSLASVYDVFIDGGDVINIVLK